MKKISDFNSKVVEFSCISCDQIFKVYSTLPKDALRIEVCGNCHTFYTGKSSANVKTGKIEVFNRRERESEKKRTTT